MIGNDWGGGEWLSETRDEQRCLPDRGGGWRRRLHVHAVQPMGMREDGRATRTFLRHTTAPSYLSTLLAFAGQNPPRTRRFARPPSPERATDARRLSVDLAIYISVGNRRAQVLVCPTSLTPPPFRRSCLPRQAQQQELRTHHVVPEGNSVAVRCKLQPPAPRQASAYRLARRWRSSGTA